MNIGRGLKAIVNVGFWIWIAIGALLIIGGINGGDTTQIFFGLVFGVALPVIIRIALFYIIDSFK
mgnify:FL=1